MEISKSRSHVKVFFVCNNSIFNDQGIFTIGFEQLIHAALPYNRGGLHAEPAMFKILGIKKTTNVRN